MEHIVVGFDGSNASWVALDWAAERAARGPCQVEVVTVEHEDLLTEPAGSVAGAERRIMDRAPDAEIVTHTLAGGMPRALLRAAEVADLLVIGAHRRHPVRSALTGWLPVRTVSRSQVPIVVVPEDWTFTDGPIVVGVDDDDSSSAAVGFAAAEAESSRSELTLLHAWQMPEPSTEGAGALLASSTHVKAVHRGLLDQASDRVAQTHPGLQLDRVLVENHPSSALVSRSEGASLLVLGTHGRGLLEGALLGSVCQDALSLSSSPVCVVPATTRTM